LNGYEHGNLYYNDAFAAAGSTNVTFTTATNATFVEANQGATIFTTCNAGQMTCSQTGNILRNYTVRAGGFASFASFFTQSGSNVLTSGGRVNSGTFPGLATDNAQTLALDAVTFAALGTPANGTVMYCSDCTIASPCAGSGTGALAKRLNGAWVCN
jgi:hypothetical protein